jgi:aspartate 1-decarboxylase
MILIINFIVDPFIYNWYACCITTKKTLKLVKYLNMNNSSLVKFVRAKFHGIYVTDANLNYQGSITLDPEYCKILGIYPLEFVEIWNKNNGMRISTYVILGKKGSKCCVLNGSAARTCQVGDELIIAASHYADPQKITELKPKVLTFNKDNNIKSILEYEVTDDDNKYYQFNIKEIN